MFEPFALLLEVKRARKEAARSGEASRRSGPGSVTAGSWTTFLACAPESGVARAWQTKNPSVSTRAGAGERVREWKMGDTAHKEKAAAPTTTAHILHIHPTTYTTYSMIERGTLRQAAWTVEPTTGLTPALNHHHPQPRTRSAHSRSNCRASARPPAWEGWARPACLRRD